MAGRRLLAARATIRGLYAKSEGVIEGDEGLSVASFGSRERRLEVVGSAHLERLKRHPQLPGCRLGLLPEDGMDCDQRIPEHGDPGKPWQELFQELQALAADRFIEIAQPRHVSSGARQARHQAEPNGISRDHDDRDGLGGFLGRQRCLAVPTTRTSTLRRTSSATSSGIRSYRPSAQRTSSAIVCPST